MICVSVSNVIASENGPEDGWLHMMPSMIKSPPRAAKFEMRVRKSKNIFVYFCVLKKKKKTL